MSVFSCVAVGSLTAYYRSIATEGYIQCDYLRYLEESLARHTSSTGGGTCMPGIDFTYESDCRGQNEGSGHSSTPRPVRGRGLKLVL